MEFYEALKKERLGKGLTQADLAKSVRLGYSTIRRFENGDLEPNARQTERLASIFGISPWELYKYTKEGRCIRKWN